MSIPAGSYGGNPQAVDIVTLTQVNPTGPNFRCHLAGEDTLTEGAARWEVVNRPGRTSTVEWVGSDLYLLTVPLKLHGWGILPGGGSRTVEPSRDRLMQWQRPLVGANGAPISEEPPAIAIAGPVRQPPYRPWWVIAGLEWGEGFYGEGPLEGVLISQDVTVTFREHLQGQVLRGTAAQARARAGL